MIVLLEATQQNTSGVVIGIPGMILIFFIVRGIVRSFQNGGRRKRELDQWHRDRAYEQEYAAWYAAQQNNRYPPQS